MMILTATVGALCLAISSELKNDKVNIKNKFVFGLGILLLIVAVYSFNNF